MATIKVDMGLIEDHLAQRNSINVTSFSWNERNDPDFEWEIDTDISDLEYEDEDYVELDEHRELKRLYDEMERRYDEMERDYEDLNTKYDILMGQFTDQTKELKQLKEKHNWFSWFK